MAEPLSAVAKAAVESKSHMRGVLISLRGLCALYGSEESDDYILVSPTVMKSDDCGGFRWVGLVGVLHLNGGLGLVRIFLFFPREAGIQGVEAQIRKLYGTVSM